MSLQRFNLSSLKKVYCYPEIMKRDDGTSKYAFVTFMMINDSYLPGALLFAYALREKRTQADLVCMVTNKISESARFALGLLFDHVVEVEEIFIPHKRRNERQDLPFMFTRFNSLRMGEDGDLGFRYEKIVVADADVLPLRFYDHLFTLDTPAGIINEKKSYFLEYDSDGKYIIPECVYTEGKWKWHSIYEPICPHGHRIPKEITELVKTDPENLGINGSLFVITPSYKQFKKKLDDIAKPEVKNLIGDGPTCNTLLWPGQENGQI